MRQHLLTVGLLLPACSQPAPPSDTPNSTTSVGTVDRASGNSEAATNDPADVATRAPVATPNAMPDDAGYLGRWIGVEGMYLDIARRSGGGVSLEMQWDLDHKDTFDGTVEADGVHFMRNGTAEVAKFTDGDATGLKWLAGKKRCLTVTPGEGYCRD